MSAQGAVRTERVVTQGTFSLDGETFDVDNNVWLVGDEEEVLIIDAALPQDSDKLRPGGTPIARTIHQAVAGRHVTAIACTHAHDDHVDAAAELSVLTGAPVLLHPDDKELWSHTHPARKPDGELTDGRILSVAGIEIQVIHNPGHTWGSCSFFAPFLNAVFTGDTLFHGGPGATGRSYSDRPTIEASLRNRLLPLPGDTVVHTGHGQDTTIAAERPNVPAV